MKQLFSLRRITAGIVSAIANYPLVIIMAVALGAESIWLIHHEETDLFDEALPWMLAQGMGISLFFALHTVSRYRKLSRPVTAGILIAGIGVLYLIGYHFDYMMSMAREETMVLEVIGYALASHLLVAFLPFFRKNTLNGFWQYNKSLFLRAFTTILYTGVLFAGLSGAIAAIQELFDVEFTGKIFAYLWFVMAFPVSALIFCAGVPLADDIDALESSSDLPSGLRLFVQFVLLPLVVVYLCILYAYMGKIILSWTLPQGWVTILIMAFSVIGMLAMLLVHPFQQLTEHAWIKVITKNYYRSLLPLLVLQYVAIFTRISDYGFTSARWAVVAITAWLTFITVYKVFFKGKNIILIPNTLFIVAILFLIGPLSHKSISVWSQTAKINRLVKTLNLIDAKGKLKVYKANTTTDSLMGEIYSATRYLNRNHQCTGLEPYINFPTESEIIKEMKSTFEEFELAQTVEAPVPTTAAEAVAQKQQQDSLVADTTTFATSPSGERKFDRYDRRTAIRSLLSEQYESFGIKEFNGNRRADNNAEIWIKPEQPQVLIPLGGWTKSYPIQDAYFYNLETITVSDYLNMVKITLDDDNQNIVLMIDGESFNINLSDLRSRYLKNEGLYVEIPNKELVIPFGKGKTAGVLVITEMRWDKDIKKAKWELQNLRGTLYMK
ncbi:MAG: DUF4153 domain-containing protein, partial [Bacteroidota bacterium]